MTEAEFKAKHGPDWRRITSEPAFIAFMDMARRTSPVHDQHSVAERLQGAAMFHCEEVGYYRMLNKIESCASVDTDLFEPPTTFAEPEEI